MRPMNCGAKTGRMRLGLAVAVRLILWPGWPELRGRASERGSAGVPAAAAGPRRDHPLRRHCDDRLAVSSFVSMVTRRKGWCVEIRGGMAESVWQSDLAGTGLMVSQSCGGQRKGHAFTASSGEPVKGSVMSRASSLHPGWRSSELAIRMHPR